LYQFYSTTSDHYLYQPMLGPALALAWIVARFEFRWLYVASTAAIMALGLRSFFQAEHWKTELDLWRHTVAVTPHSFQAYLALGNALARAGDEDAAPAMYRKSLEIFPDYW